MTQNLFTPEEMLGYRDQVVRNLQHEVMLLDDLNQKGLFDKDEGIFTRTSYPEKVGIIQGEIQKLNNFDVVLSVVGTMKAGKSTTINAIVGREILPNRNRPMTALPTLIYHNAEQKKPVLSFHNPAVVEFVQKLQSQLNQNPNWQNTPELSTDEMQALMTSIKDGWNFQETYQGENEIFEFLAKLNDLVRLSEILHQKSNEIRFPFEQCKEIAQLPKIEVAFRHLIDMPANQGRLILLDTPGPNEAGQAHLRTMLAEQLKRSSAVLLVLDYTQLKSEASASVKEQLEDVPNIQKDRLFALVNKFDQRNANSDDEEATKDLIFNDFLKDRIEREHVFPLSSYEAFLANRMAQELELNDKPTFDQEKWVADFAKLAFGATDAEEWDEDTEINDIQKKIERLIKRSKVQEPLDNAIRKTQLEAPRIAIQSALAQLRDLLEDAHNFCNISLSTAQKETEEEIAKYKSMIERVEKHIDKLEGLQSNTDKMITEFKESIETDLKNVVQTHKEKIISDAKIKIDEVINGIRETYNLTYEKSKYSKFYWTKDDFNQMKQSFYEVATLKELSNDNSIAFAQENLAGTFHKGVQGIFNVLMEEEISSVSETYTNKINSVKTYLNQIDKDVEDTLNDIEKEFLKEHIQIELSKPNIIESLELDDSNIDFSQFLSKENKSVEVDQKGFWADVFRFFGANPKETIKVDYYEVNISAMYEKFHSVVYERMRPIEAQIQNLLALFNDNWKDNYIGTITKRAQDLQSEAKSQLAELEQNKGNKESFKEEIEELQTQTQKIQDEMADLSKKFGISKVA